LSSGDFLAQLSRPPLSSSSLYFSLKIPGPSTKKPSVSTEGCATFDLRQIARPAITTEITTTTPEIRRESERAVSALRMG